MKIALVIAKFNRQANGVYEYRRNTVNTWKKAEAWLHRMDRLKFPAMFYVVGSFNTALPQFCKNYYYRREYKKVRD